MYTSVSQRVKAVPQPYGGYIRPSSFEVIKRNDGIKLNEEENIHGSVVGMVVDYLTRVCLGTAASEVFRVSMEGAIRAELLGMKKAETISKKLLLGIKGVDDKSIINACKLVTFDVWVRNPLSAMMAKGYDEINPDKKTIQNIQTLIKRSLSFFDDYGPIEANGFTFEPEDADENAYEQMLDSQKGTYGGYTPTIDSGDGDYLTADTLWDFKVAKSKITKEHTLQLLVYWIMGQHSGQKRYKKISQLGIFNPRQNVVYLLKIKDIPEEIIKTVEKEVICYDKL